MRWLTSLYFLVPAILIIMAEGALAKIFPLRWWMYALALCVVMYGVFLGMFWLVDEGNLSWAGVPDSETINTTA